jgi:hypothetical protein
VGKGRGAGREEGAGVAGGHGEERAGGRLKTRLTVGSHLAEREGSEVRLNGPAVVGRKERVGRPLGIKRRGKRGRRKNDPLVWDWTKRGVGPREGGKGLEVWEVLFVSFLFQTFYFKTFQTFNT